MASHPRVGVLTFHRSINYGSYWQARCLVEGLRARGCDAELVDHRSVAVERRELRCAFQPALPIRTPRDQHPALGRKARALEAAVDALPLSAPFPLDDPAVMPRYDTVVVGSDEVWNFRHPWYGGQPLFFGEGLRADRLVSYAASFGNHDAADGLDQVSVARLRRFAALSVRDDNARDLLSEALGEVPPLVLDPCLQFADVIPTDTAPGRYLLLYGHSFPTGFAAAVRRYADKAGLPIVSVGYGNSIADRQRIDADPAEFAALFAGAHAVATNFFHGCVFALRFGKPLVAAAMPYRRNKLRDLTRKLAVEHCLVGEEADEATVSARLSAAPEGVAERLVVLRAASTRYLDAALG
ncbi:polysaccharide pyruvyl transferase family protein [Sphingomonas corticis]|jgi:hypothetical protein|uniref:Polysaccharide pyruvyl transferase family protein n=1 Tax=Sphingomonas corticis TaxID=2722791 RepID=A0ABX1CNF6_9SPHN|nr:polysaccharide pyruvyl transferase family protein [Sphingomonas corticis]NJR79498.1 polysaccharide pyruvyl transferase family protein [Sphingomonas corticis]